MDEQEREAHEMYRELEIVDWFHAHRGPHVIGELLDGEERISRTTYWWKSVANRREELVDAVNRLASAHSNVLRKVSGENVTFEWQDCPVCGSPQGDGSCSYDCDFGVCPNPECDFVGRMGGHLESWTQGSGYTGAPIFSYRYACGFEEWDLSRDNLEAAR